MCWRTLGRRSKNLTHGVGPQTFEGHNGWSPGVLVGLPGELTNHIAIRDLDDKTNGKENSERVEGKAGVGPRSRFKQKKSKK